MSLLEALILGFVQGATEFLPVSSSGHSVLVPAILGLPAPSLSAIVVAHQGTLLAVLLYFWRDVWLILKGVWQGLVARQPLGSVEARLGWYIVLASIPAAAAGYALESKLELAFADPRWAAGFLILTAIVLLTGERLLSGRKDLATITWVDALVVGIFQMFALLPGLSRSGSTITAGLARGLNRPSAARFSFLLSIPVILGAGMLKLVEMLGAAELEETWLPLLAIFVVAAVTGYACIHFLLQWLRQRSLKPFAAYCAIFGSFYLLAYYLL